MKINERLKIIANLVDENSKVLDIGCDHAFLDIYLVKLNKGIISVASDINPGPLEIAKENIKTFNLENVIETRLGNGLDVYTKDINTLVISGMGGETILNIFKKDLKALETVNTIILSPNSDQDEIRRFLTNNGFYIDDEKLIKDRKFIYQIIKFKKGNRKYSDIDYLIGPINKLNDTLLKQEFIKKELNKRQEVLNHLPEKYVNKISKIKEEIEIIKTIV